MMKNIWIALLLIVCLAISGCDVANGKAIPISGKIIFESTHGFRKDKVRSLYLWENGKTKKLFTGASSPRFNEDGSKIAIVQWNAADILILGSTGKILQRLVPTYFPAELGWMNSDTLFYIGTDRGKIPRPKYYLVQIDLNTGKESILYTTAEVGQIRNISWNQEGKLFVFGLSDQWQGDNDLVSRIVFFDPESKAITTQYINGFSPVLLQDNKTLIFTTSHLPDGTKIEKFSWSILMKYDIATKEYEIIRPTAWVRNIRLSRDGKYLYASEEVERDGVGIHIYSIDNLKEPLYVIRPMKDQYGTLSQDLRPDWVA